MTLSDVQKMTNEEFYYWLAYYKIKEEKYKNG